MELIRDHLEVQTYGTPLGQFQLGIDEANFRLVMDILIELYTDPISSVVRELGANAVDAHIAAGRPHLPIEVRLPTVLSPTFVIRDRGLGMTKEFIEHTYGRLLSSTKRDDNEGIGGYGIGSKSPLGYTDSYTFSSRVAGTELHVHVSRNGGFTSGGSNPTTQEDGTTVHVPVKSEDCEAFKKAVAWLRYMTPSPLINGTPMVVEEVLLEGKGEQTRDKEDGYEWFIAKDTTPYCNRPYILLGPIPYPLDIYKLGNLTTSQRCVAEAPFMRLKFPIGSLSVTPSRETLRYDEGTINTIRDALNSVYKPAMDAIEKLLASYEWEVDARRLYSQSRFSNWCRGSNLRKYGSTISLPTMEKWVKYGYAGWKSTVTMETVNYHGLGNEAEIFLNDKPPRSRRRIDAYVRGKGPDYNLIVGPLDSEVVGQKLFPTRLLSELPDVQPDVQADEDEEVVVPKKVLPRLERGTMRARKWTAECTSPEKVLLYAHTEECTMPLEGSGYYLVMSAGRVLHPHVTTHPLEARNIGQMLAVLQSNLGTSGVVVDSPVYVVLPQQVQRLGSGYKELINTTHEQVLPYLTWIKHLYEAPSLLPALYGVSVGDCIQAGVSNYLLEYVKLQTEANKVVRVKSSTLWGGVLNLYINHLPTLWDTTPMKGRDPLKELHYLVDKVYNLDTFRTLNLSPLRHYLAIVDANLERTDGEDGWYGSCKLTEGHPTDTMGGRELMIHYYKDYGNVREYYERFDP